MIIPPAHLRAVALFFAFWLLPANQTRGAENLSPLGKSPDWNTLEKYQETITRDDFARVLETVYCTRGVSGDLLQVEADGARIAINREDQTWFTLRFAKDQASSKPVPRTWRPSNSLSPAKRGRELSGLQIALDPGHLGGAWAEMEERWFQVGDSAPVQEGDMTLRVAKLLAPRLRTLGAKVSLVRDEAAPVTSKRPDDLKEVSKKILMRTGDAPPRDDFEGPADPQKEHTVRWQNERLFYRNSEIRQRAEVVNSEIRPDLVLCLHFNAEAWDDPRNPKLVDQNHLHLLVNGAYLADELDYDDLRFEMLQRLLSRTHEEEIGLAEKLAETMAKRTGLPPYEYTTENVTRLGRTGYIFARNLVATRLYQSPVIYFEPYVMNSDETFWRIQAGDYEGRRNVNGTERPSIYREYVAGIVDGLVQHYRAARK